MTRTALILGASGRFGRHAQAALEHAGWQTRKFDRTTDDLCEVAQGCAVIVNGWNPPYDRWESEVPALTRKVIAAAQVSGARVVIPGNVYPFGPGAPKRLTAETPHLAQNPLGRVRIAMETEYRLAGVKTLILRGGDFLDTEASGNWFDQVLTQRLDKGILTYPGAADVVHAWAFLPDMTRAMAMLLDQAQELPTFLDLGFPGYALTGDALASAVGRVLGRDITVRPMSWWPIRLASPVWPMGRHLLEMRYLWNMPHQIDGKVMAAYLPGFQATPLEAALRQSLQHKIHPDQAVTPGGAPVLT